MKSQTNMHNDEQKVAKMIQDPDNHRDAQFIDEIATIYGRSLDWLDDYDH